MPKQILIEEHSVEDLFTKLDKIHEQTKKTNGRVTRLESQSLGRWVSNHPFKFSIGVLVTIATVISDLRHPIIAALTNLFI